MCPADLMLLDEPTNHLTSTRWSGWKPGCSATTGTLVVISHDREFLDAITTVTLHLDEAKLTRYGGNYTTLRGDARRTHGAAAGQPTPSQQERIAHLQKFIDRFKAKASKAKQAQSRVKALARMEKLAPVLTASDFEFEFREPQSPAQPDAGAGWPGCGYRRRRWPPSHRARHQPLGAGRPAHRHPGRQRPGQVDLVKTIAHELPPLAARSPRARAWHRLLRPAGARRAAPADGPLMHMIRLARDVGPPAREQELRDFLGTFRFSGDMVKQAVGSMSGGEKAAWCWPCWSGSAPTCCC